MHSRVSSHFSNLPIHCTGEIIIVHEQTHVHTLKKFLCGAHRVSFMNICVYIESHVSVDLFGSTYMYMKKIFFRAHKKVKILLHVRIYVRMSDRMHMGFINEWMMVIILLKWAAK